MITTQRETFDPGRSSSAVGTSVPRADGRAKVTAQARYVEDNIRPGTLYAAVVRSLYPLARIVSVDTRVAAEQTGVVTVLSGVDLVRTFGERVWSGPAFADQPILAVERVRYIGEPVAVVAAATRANEYMAGNLCRCGAYPEIMAAVRQASQGTAAHPGPA